MSRLRRKRSMRGSSYPPTTAVPASRRSERTFASTISRVGWPGSSTSSIARLRGFDSSHSGTVHPVSKLSHVDETGAVQMVDVGGKALSRRRAVARAEVRMAAETVRRLRELPKGDALATAQVAGIMAAKRTSDLIPLCHPLPLSHVEVTLEVGAESVEITGVVETTAQTGVEMEALTAVSVAALTVYDMAKAIDNAMVVTNVALVEKTKEPA